MSIITSLIKTIPALIAGGNAWCVVAIMILGVVGYYFHDKIVRKLSKSVCAYKDNCKLESFKTNRTILLSIIRTTLNNAQDKFASDLVDYINSGNKIDDVVRDRIILVHNNLMMSVFYDFTLDSENMLLFNHFPDPNID